MMNSIKLDWPEGKQFAFSVFDDTDGACIQNVGPIYDFLKEIGVLTTKSIWCAPPPWGRSVEEVAQELHVQLNESDWLEKAGAASRCLAETHFDRDVLARQLEQVLAAAVDGKSDRAEAIAPGVY